MVLPNPDYLTSVEYDWNDTQESAVVIDDSAPETAVKSIRWSRLNHQEKVRFHNLIMAYAAKGGDTEANALANLASIEGWQSALFSASLVGANPSGLPANTAATQTANYGGAVVGGNATGLVLSQSASAGYQEVDVGGDKVGGDPTAIPDVFDAIAATQVVDVGGDKVGGTATGLANDATEYTASIETIGGTIVPITIVGSDAQTYTTLLSELNDQITGIGVVTLSSGDLLLTSEPGYEESAEFIDVDLFSSLTDFGGIADLNFGEDESDLIYSAEIEADEDPISVELAGPDIQTFTTLLAEIDSNINPGSDASIVGGNIRITSASTGSTSTVAITDVTREGYQDIDLGGEITGGTLTGLADDATEYSFSVTIDGNIFVGVAVAGEDVQTYTELLTEVNIQLNGDAILALEQGNVRLTSATEGSESHIRIHPGVDGLFSELATFVAYDSPERGYAGLFESIGDFASILESVPGEDSIDEVIYTATVKLRNNTYININISGNDAQTFTELVSELNAAVDGFVTVAIAGGNITFTTDALGDKETINVYDGTLFDATTAFDSFGASVNGTGMTVPFTATVTVDGIAIPISINGNAALTFTTLVAQINADLGMAATAALSGSMITITSAVAGTGSSVVIRDNNLFKKLTGFIGLSEPYHGIATLEDVLHLNYFGQNPIEQILNIMNVPPKPVGWDASNQDLIYFNHDSGDWRYYFDDSLVTPVPE